MEMNYENNINKLEDVNVDKLDQERGDVLDANVINLYNNCIEFIKEKNKNNIKNSSFFINNNAEEYHSKVIELLNKKGIFGEYKTDRDMYYDDVYYFDLYWGKNAEDEFKKDVKSQSRFELSIFMIFIGLPLLVIIAIILKPIIEMF